MEILVVELLKSGCLLTEKLNSESADYQKKADLYDINSEVLDALEKDGVIRVNDIKSYGKSGHRTFIKI